MKSKFSLTVIVSSMLSSLPGTLISADEIDKCGLLQECIQRIYEVAEPPESHYSNVSKREWAVAKRLSSFGETAVGKLIPLLKDSNENVAQIAAAALRDIPHINEKYLPDIIAALDSDYDLGWLPSALGRIETDAAAKEAVTRYVGSKSAPHNQEAYAIKLSGKRAVPFIIQAALCIESCGRDDHYELGAVLEDMDEAAKNDATRRIAQYLADPDLREESLQGLIYLLSFLKESAQIIESQLIDLRRNRPQLAGVINMALIGMKSPYAAEAFAYRLSIEPDELVLRDLAEMGPAGRNAGNVVVGLMDHESWSIRIAATLTVGYIGYGEAIPKLIDKLNDPNNLKLNWAAAESLGRLRGATAATALKQIASHHWYPPVREAAQRALRNLKSGSEYLPQDDEEPLTYDFFGYWHGKIEPCEKIIFASVEEDKSIKLYTHHAKKQLEELAFPSEVLSYGAADEMDQRAANPDGIIEVRADNIIEHREPIMQVPRVALRAETGWLVGSDRGEWGGELAFIADTGGPRILLRENVEDIYKLGDRYVAVTGLAHLGLNDGLIYEITRVGNSWSVKPWRALPGAPRTSWFVETGELLINTYGGGSVLVSKEGGMRMAKCL